MDDIMNGKSLDEVILGFLAEEFGSTSRDRGGDKGGDKNKNK